MVRLAPFMTGSDLVILVGCLTAFMAGVFGFFQADLKRVIAFSTCSQLGLLQFLYLSKSMPVLSTGIVNQNPQQKAEFWWARGLVSWLSAIIIALLHYLLVISKESEAYSFSLSYFVQLPVEHAYCLVSAGNCVQLPVEHAYCLVSAGNCVQLPVEHAYCLVSAGNCVQLPVEHAYCLVSAGYCTQLPVEHAYCLVSASNPPSLRRGVGGQGTNPLASSGLINRAYSVGSEPFKNKLPDVYVDRLSDMSAEARYVFKKKISR
jgi:hypothetical protein